MIITFSIFGYLLLGVLLVRSLKLTTSRDLQKWFWLSGALRVIGGVAVGLIYAWYYESGDTWNYFQQAISLRDHLLDQPGDLWNFLIGNSEGVVFPYASQPRAKLMTGIVTLFSFAGFNNYYLTAVYFSVLSFMACWRLADRLVLYFKLTIPAVAGFLLLPVLLIWGSGILKESLLVIGLALWVSVLLDLVVGKRLGMKNIVYIFISAFLILKLKYYFAAVLFPISLSIVTVWLIDTYYRPLRKRVVMALFLIFLLVFTWPATLLHPNLSTARIADVIVQNHDVFIKKSSPENVIQFRELEPEWSSIGRNIPLALLSGLYRPFPSERGNVFKRVAGAGNLVLLFLTLAALRQKWPQDKYLSLFLIACMLYIVTLAAFLSISTPNFGTLSRYKAGYLPFFVYLLLMNRPLIQKVRQKTARIKWINL